MRDQSGIEFGELKGVLCSTIAFVVVTFCRRFGERYGFHGSNLLHFGSVENTKLGPKASESGHIPASLSPERQIVLKALRAATSPLRVRDLVQEFGLHENTIREHLEGLVASEHAERVTLISPGRGRPSYGYRSRTDFVAEIEPQVREYASLALVLAKQLAAIGGNAKQAAISAGEEWAHEFLNSAQAPSKSKVAVRQRVYEILHSLGYSPAASSKRSPIRLQSCPLLAAARLEPEIICSVHLGLIRGLISQSGENPDAVELIQFAEPGSCRLTLP